MAEQLNCWHCGASLAGLPLPLGRRDECPGCTASLHACRLCDFYDTGTSKDCREPMADEVTDKESANFCDYFRPRAGLSGGQDPEAAKARARLEAVFGGGASGGGSTDAAAGEEGGPDPEAEASRRKLEALFGKKD